MKVGEAFDYVDTVMFVYIFRPISNFLDKYCHINPWQLAIYVFMLSAICSTMSLVFGEPHWYALDIPLAMLIILVRALDIYRLSKISEKYEAKPSDTLDINWLYFFLPFNRRWHWYLGLILLPIDIFAAFNHNHDWLGITAGTFARSWFFIAGIGFYFAALPRPPAKRKEYKMPEFTAHLTPVIAGSK